MQYISRRSNTLADIYDYHEIYLENGKRLDSCYPDAREIISRKATDLDKISEETYRKYLSEFEYMALSACAGIFSMMFGVTSTGIEVLDKQQ